MTTPQDGFEEVAYMERIEAMCAEVEAALLDGGYAAGDEPQFPEEELRWLLGQRKKALRIIEAWHQMSNHLRRIVEASPQTRAEDVWKALSADYEDIEKERRRDPDE